MHRPSSLSSLVLYMVLILAIAPGLVAEEAPQARIYTAEQVYGPYDLKPDQLQQIPAGVVPISFEEKSWLVGYRTEVIDGEGKPLGKEMHCHTMMMNGMGLGDTHMQHAMDAFPFKGVYTDGYTNFVRLPRGFGIPFTKDETLDMIPMFNNRDSASMSASMRVEAFFLLDRELPETLTPLYSTIQSVSAPHLYHVEPGTDTREKEFAMPYGGTIHAMGVHIHPYGRSIELLEATTGTCIWEFKGEVGEDGTLLSIPFFSSETGIPFKEGQRFLLRATYENVTDTPQDAMAGLFLFFSTEDGKPPKNPTGGMEGHGGHGEGHSDHGGHQGHGRP